MYHVHGRRYFSLRWKALVLSRPTLSEAVRWATRAVDEGQPTTWAEVRIVDEGRPGEGAQMYWRHGVLVSQILGTREG